MEGLVKLHLGCGSVYRPGFVNIDISRAGVADVVGDALRLPFKDESAERIEAFHVIEHFDLVHCRYLLAEWFRVMAEGGHLIIETPDLEETMKRLVKSSPHAQRRTVQWIFGIDSPGLGHKTGFTRDLLAETLKAAGFTGLKWRRQETHRYEEGMRVECARPRTTTRARLNSAFRSRMVNSCMDLDSYALVPMEDAMDRALKLVPGDGPMKTDDILRAAASLVIRNPCAASAFIAAVRGLGPGGEDELSTLEVAVEQLSRDRMHHRVFATWIASRKEFPLDVQFDRFMGSVESDVAHALMDDVEGSKTLTYLMNKEPVEIAALTFELVQCQAGKHLGIGTRYLELGKLDLAKEHLETACNIDPANPHAHWMLGRLLAASEEAKGPAINELEIALSLAAQKGDRASIERDLRKLKAE